MRVWSKTDLLWPFWRLTAPDIIRCLEATELTVSLFARATYNVKPCMIKEPYSDYRSESGLVFVPFLFAVLMESIGFVLWSRSCHFFLPFIVGAGTFWNVQSRTGHLSNSSFFGKSRAETGIFLERPESRSRHFRNRNLFGASRAEAGIFFGTQSRTSALFC